MFLGPFFLILGQSFAACLEHWKGGFQRKPAFCMPWASIKVSSWRERIYVPDAHCHPAVSLKHAMLFSSALLMSTGEGRCCQSPLSHPCPAHSRENSGCPWHPTMHRGIPARPAVETQGAFQKGQLWQQAGCQRHLPPRPPTPGCRAGKCSESSSGAARMSTTCPLAPYPLPPSLGEEASQGLGSLPPETPSAPLHAGGCL